MRISTVTEFFSHFSNWFHISLMVFCSKACLHTECWIIRPRKYFLERKSYHPTS